MLQVWGRIRLGGQPGPMGVVSPPQGCLAPVRVVIPKGSILDPSPEAAVVGGNVLTSQRVVDVIFRAFGVCAASQVGTRVMGGLGGSRGQGAGCPGVRVPGIQGPRVLGVRGARGSWGSGVLGILEFRVPGVPGVRGPRGLGC